MIGTTTFVFLCYKHNRAHRKKTFNRKPNLVRREVELSRNKIRLVHTLSTTSLLPHCLIYICKVNQAETQWRGAEVQNGGIESLYIASDVLFSKHTLKDRSTSQSRTRNRLTVVLVTTQENKNWILSFFFSRRNV